MCGIRRPGTRFIELLATKGKSIWLVVLSLWLPFASLKRRTQTSYREFSGRDTGVPVVFQ